MLNRVSLNTIGLNRIGLNRIGKPSRASSDRPYIDPEVLASLKAVCICYGKSNDDPDRVVVKNLVDPDNPFVISNAAYTEGSGYADKDSPYYGAFVTDGIDDLITSTKTVQEMLGGSNEITVVSMIHQIGLGCRTNFICDKGSYWRCNEVANTGEGKTGIYGYSSTNISVNTPNIINNVLGDKVDYSVTGDRNDLTPSQFSVVGYISSSGKISYTSSVAWYWTIIANKVLTTDQINQVIAYFNLDRTLNPDILCNTIKQGITNENHEEFGDKLIDFSGNGRDIQLNNIAWKGDSGIGKYAADFTSWTTPKEVQKTSDTVKITTEYTEHWVAYLAPNNTFKSMKVLISGIPDGGSLQFFRTTADGGGIKMVNGINKIPEFTNTVAAGFYIDVPLGFDWSNLVIEQIPSHAGALCLDGVNDFGKVTGMPVYKDYTVVTDREIFANIGAILSKNNPGAFVETAGNSVYSFGQATSGLKFISTRSISYLSKYSYCGQSIAAGAAEDVPDMWLGTIRDGDSRFLNGAIYSLMSFPYSMSEFLIERQLKKHKLGTLYPDMVEFRPIVKSNAEYQVVDCYIDTLPAVVGNYYPINSKLRIDVTTKGAADEVTSLTINGTSLGTLSVNGNRFTFKGTLPDKSPQKINITIDEYIRYEDIVQPYPVFFEFTDENGNLISWGGKAKVGSTITRTKGVNYANLLEGLFTITNPRLNGVPLSSSQHVVEKSMVFTCTATWAFDNNEPKCILSPRLLSIPNSSYKILGYIPDISGHGNHGVINNSAYAGMSGANGYPNNFNNYTIVSGVTKTDNSIKVEKELSGSGWFLYIPANTAVASMKLNIDGIPSNKTVKWATNVEGIGDITLTNGVNEIPSYTSSTISGIYAIYSDLTGLSIQQIGEYEGAYCLDGVDDFVTIPTLFSGGKQVLMKVNWQKDGVILYDQRGNNDEFAIYAYDEVEKDIAYNSRNNGKTYIDGILNKNIKSSELKGLLHNITIINPLNLGISKKIPVIGANSNYNGFFAQMALFDFMLFDDISTDDKIKQLNEYVGIEGNTDDLFNETN